VLDLGQKRHVSAETTSRSGTGPLFGKGPRVPLFYRRSSTGIELAYLVAAQASKRILTLSTDRSAGPWNTASILLPSGSNRKAAK
jgi:hypothetical protein